MNESFDDKVFNSLLSVEPQLDAYIAWKLLASFSRLFTVSVFTRACFSSFFRKCALLMAAGLILVGVIFGSIFAYSIYREYSIYSRVYSRSIYLMRWLLHQAIYDLSRTSLFCDSSFLYCFRWHLKARFSVSVMAFATRMGRRQWLTSSGMFIVFSRSRDENRSIPT